MKIVVKEAITCKSIKKYLPKCYRDVFPANFGNKGENVNIVIFPCDRKGVVTGRYIEKALQKMKGFSLLTVYSREQRAKWLLADIWRLPRGSNTPLLCSAASLIPRCLQWGL